MSKAVLFFADGTEECEALLVADLLRRARVEVIIASAMGRRALVSSHGIHLNADALAEDVDYSDVDMVILPGGLGGVHSILASETAMNFIRLAYEKNCLIAAICAAPTILASLHITDGRRATCYPGLEDQMDAAKMIPCGAVQDGNVITGRAAGSADEFGLACLRALKGEDTARQVASDIVYRV